MQGVQERLPRVLTGVLTGPGSAHAAWQEAGPLKLAALVDAADLEVRGCTAKGPAAEREGEHPRRPRGRLRRFLQRRAVRH